MSEHVCEICHGPLPSYMGMCFSCKRSYDRHAHDEGTVYEAMRWAANRAGRLRGSIRGRQRGLATIAFDADELVMLRDRVAVGAEISEEQGWDDLLAKIERAQEQLLARTKVRR